MSVDVISRQASSECRRGQAHQSVPLDPARCRSTGGRWLVVKTHTHKEEVAAQSLQRLSFSTYLPVVQRRIRHARRVRDVRRPLFPGYLFVDVTGDDSAWRSIRSAFGVRQLVRAGTELAFLPGSVIDGIRCREVDGVIRKPACAFIVGQHVRLQGEAFDGLVATIIEMDEKQRFVVLMNWLNQSVRVRLEADRLVAC